VVETLGRREQRKRATRAALQAAADRLFAERGYDATTVRDIAQAAGVTERTFFRYFAVKEELALGAALGWLEQVRESILARPREEAAVVALHRVVLDLEARMRASDGPTLLTLFADRRPAEYLGPRPGRRQQLRLLAIETLLAPAIRERLLADGQADDALLDFRSAALARTCVALVRSALVHDLRLRTADVPGRPTLRELLDVAFGDLRRAWGPDPDLPPG
jgi:AcrR family transcriptional regulator